MLCLTALVIWFRLEPIADRALKIREHTPMPKTEPMPADLLMMCNGLSEGWARDDAEKRLRELYAATGDWDRVRAIGPVLFGEQSFGTDA